MKFIELKKVIGSQYKLCISNSAAIRRFVENYLRSTYKFTGEIGFTWQDLSDTIADYDELYMESNKLIVSEYIDQNFYNDLEVIWLESDGYKLLIHLGYKSLN